MRGGRTIRLAPWACRMMEIALSKYVVRWPILSAARWSDGEANATEAASFCRRTGKTYAACERPGSVVKISSRVGGGCGGRGGREEVPAQLCSNMSNMQHPTMIKYRTPLMLWTVTTTILAEKLLPLIFAPPPPSPWLENSSLQCTTIKLHDLHKSISTVIQGHLRPIESNAL